METRKLMAETGLKLEGLRKYTVALTGLLVLALAVVASGEQIPYEPTLSSNGTTHHSIESNYLFDLFNLLRKKSEIHYHHVWPVSSCSLLTNRTVFPFNSCFYLIIDMTIDRRIQSLNMKSSIFKVFST